MSTRSRRLVLPRGSLMGGLLLIALLAFETFNFSTTDFALHDLLGELKFLGLRWSVILAVAFCGIDFAGIARLFSMNQEEEPVETWYLFGAWFLAATMNAMLTWWGVSVALLEHVPTGASVLGQKTVMTVVPVFVAVMVWLVRILLIGTITVAGPRIFQWHFGMAGNGRGSTTSLGRSTSSTRMRSVRSLRPSSETRTVPSVSSSRPSMGEPTYEPLATAPRSHRPTGKRLV